MATQRPDRVCGIHFFNPAPMMRLVEVVRPLTASDDTIKTAMAFADDVRQGRRRGRRPRRLHRQRPAVPVPQQRRADARARHGVASRTSTRRCRAAATSRWARSRCSTSSASTRRSPILDALYDEFRDPNYAAVPTLRRHGRRRPARPQDRRGLLRVLSDRASSAGSGAVGRDRPRRADRAAADPLAAARRRRSPTTTGIVGVGADLEPGTLLAAYRAGLFPMPVGRPAASPGSRPTPAAIIPLDGLRVSRSLRRSMRALRGPRRHRVRAR